jgi:uncharacterized protein (DUF983 family)
MTDTESQPGLLCATCRYDMSGTPWKDGGVTCPECGTRYTERAPRANRGLGWALTMLVIGAPLVGRSPGVQVAIAIGLWLGVNLLAGLTLLVLGYMT